MSRVKAQQSVLVYFYFWANSRHWPCGAVRQRLLRVLGRLPLKDEAAYTGGRRPRSLRGGNRGTGSLGGAGAMEIVVLAVVARCAWLAGFGGRGAAGGGEGGARRGALRRQWIRV